jgi:hypothetical protein
MFTEDCQGYIAREEVVEYDIVEFHQENAI